MCILRYILSVVFISIAFQVLAQTDTTRIDSSLTNPYVKPDQPAVIQNLDSIRNIQNQSSSRQPEVYKDSARLAIEKMPRKAALNSALLPGLGQIKNGRWWKVPFIYGAFVSVGLMYEFNNRYYKIFLGEVQYRLLNNNQPLDPKYASYSYEGMVNVKDAYRRNRDLSVLLGAAAYAINIIDAYVDAKFFRYDISEDLALRIKPAIQAQPFAYSTMQYVPSIKISLSL